ncbi:MAG: hypothetical protein FD153_378 [Rhodospirillaceae bacterium]|nr:MAG: hypothetical protein FD153_378 [Rhodospirillaceae bacterium]
MFLHSHYCVPIQTEEALLGVLTLYLPPCHLGEVVVERFVAMVADTLAMVMRHAQAAEALRQTHEELELLIDLITRRLDL